MILVTAATGNTAGCHGCVVAESAPQRSRRRGAASEQSAGVAREV
jgi:hypothetical protein